MRRNDREITDSREIERFLFEQQIIRVGFYDDGEVYIVPVNYGFKTENGEYTFYFHGANAGRKYVLALSNPDVGFEIDGEYRLLPAEKACSYSACYQSVIGNGVLSLVNDTEEKTEALELIMKQATGNVGFSYDESALKKTAVFKLKVNKLSCKAKH